MTSKKPTALKVGDHFHYTLSNYDPVQVTVHVSTVTDLDVEFMAENFCRSHKTTLKKIDDAWVAEHIQGAKTVDDFRKIMRSEAERMNTQFAEDQKTSAILKELALRLEQEVPLDEIARYREQILASMKMDAERQGTTLEQFLQSMGISQINLDAMLDDRAAQAAGQDAALSAYAGHKKLKVPEEEIPALLQIPPQQAGEVLEQARKAGQMSLLEHDCKNIKAARLVVGEADVTYSHDTPEQTKEREEQLKLMLQQLRAMDNAKVVEGGKGKKNAEKASAAAQKAQPQTGEGNSTQEKADAKDKKAAEKDSKKDSKKTSKKDASE